MLTVQRFISQFESYTDEELFSAYENITDYSEKAQEALWITIKKRGGLEVIEEKYSEDQFRKIEKLRIENEVEKFYVANVELDLLSKILTSTIFSPTETVQIIEDKYSELKLIDEDEKIKPKTIFGSIVGVSLSSIVGGVVWALQMNQTHRMLYIFLAVLAIISYGIIRFFTKQSKANVVVVLATAFSVIGAILIGQLLFEIFR